MPRPHNPETVGQARKITSKSISKAAIKAAAVAAAAPIPKKPRSKRKDPGDAAKREIVKYQTSCEPLLRHVPFQKLARAKMAEYMKDVHFEKGALAAIQEAIEHIHIMRIQRAYSITLTAGRLAVSHTDLQAVDEIHDAYLCA